MKRVFLSLLLLIATLNMEAKSIEVMFVTTGNERVQFPMNDVKEVLFSDNQLTILKTNEIVLSFATSDGWKIEFGETEATSIATICNEENVKMEVYDASGLCVQKNEQGCKLQIDRLPKGRYIVKMNGKIFKINK